VSRQIKLAEFEKKVGSGFTQNAPVIKSHSVITVSNYCWFEKVKDRPNKSLKCTPPDFDIGFKLSSTAFATTRNASSEYHFDKNGVRFTYNQFYRLMRSEIFTQEYVNKIKKYYQRDQNMNVDSSIVAIDDDRDEDDEEGVDEPQEATQQEESDDDIIEAAAPSQSVKSAIVKRLKRL
jgi:hypothetical protein